MESTTLDFQPRSAMATPLVTPASHHGPVTRLKKFYFQICKAFRALRHARKAGIKIRLKGDSIEFKKSDQAVRINRRHIVYAADIIHSFDYYFSAVRPVDNFGTQLVDYSSPRYHEVVGYERCPILFPSFSEPLVTAQQYMDFAGLKPGAVVLDLGAYSGLTSILFKDLAEACGTVIAVDADRRNITAIQQNFANYRRTTGRVVELEFAAVWNHNKGLEFSSESNMGSSATELLGATRGQRDRVPSLTLSELAHKHQLATIDFIKCDIEGAEAVIFEDAHFFAQFRPRIVIETHIVNNQDTADKCIADLTRFGYECRKITQTGVSLPLIECRPPRE